MTAELQKKTAQAIINVFETGAALRNYAAMTFHPDDSDHLTYGRSQTTLASGNLYLLIKTYCAEGRRFRSRLRAYLGPLAQRDVSLDRKKEFRDCLGRVANYVLIPVAFWGGLSFCATLAIYTASWHTRMIAVTACAVVLYLATNVFDFVIEGRQAVIYKIQSSVWQRKLSALLLPGLCIGVIYHAGKTTSKR